MSLSGLGAAVTVFDEEEIVAGDIVKVELDPDVFKMMHEAALLWNDTLSQVIRVLIVYYTYHRIPSECPYPCSLYEDSVSCVIKVPHLYYCRGASTMSVHIFSQRSNSILSCEHS